MIFLLIQHIFHFVQHSLFLHFLFYSQSSPSVWTVTSWIPASRRSMMSTRTTITTRTMMRLVCLSFLFAISSRLNNSWELSAYVEIRIFESFLFWPKTSIPPNTLENFVIIVDFQNELWETQNVCSGGIHAFRNCLLFFSVEKKRTFNSPHSIVNFHIEWFGYTRTQSARLYWCWVAQLEAFNSRVGNKRVRNV